MHYLYFDFHIVPCVDIACFLIASDDSVFFLHIYITGKRRRKSEVSDWATAEVVYCKGLRPYTIFNI